jgi:hypothetical protein
MSKEEGRKGRKGAISDISFFIERDVWAYPVGVKKIFEVIQNAALRPFSPYSLHCDNRDRGAQAAETPSDFQGTSASWMAWRIACW